MARAEKELHSIYHQQVNSLIEKHAMEMEKKSAEYIFFT